MRRKKFSGQENVDQLIEDIKQTEFYALGEGAAVCVACGATLREGDKVVALAVRPANQRTLDIAQTKCIECRHEPTEHFTLGVREIVVDGRVGTCSDHATQASWPVLLTPQSRAVSPAHTTAVHPLPGTAWLRDPIAASDHFTAIDCCPNYKPWQRPVARADDTDANTDTNTTGDATSAHPTDTALPSEGGH